MRGDPARIPHLALCDGHPHTPDDLLAGRTSADVVEFRKKVEERKELITLAKGLLKQDECMLLIKTRVGDRHEDGRATMLAIPLFQFGRDLPRLLAVSG